MQNTTHMDKCMHSFNVNMHDANAIVKNLIPNISNKGQIPLIPKGYRRPILKIEHMTWTYDPKPDLKEILKVVLIDIGAHISIFHICCLATSCITISQNPSSLQALTIVLSSERGDRILLIEYSLQVSDQILEHHFLFLPVWLT